MDPVDDWFREAQRAQLLMVVTFVVIFAFAGLWLAIPFFVLFAAIELWPDGR